MDKKVLITTEEYKTLINAKELERNYIELKEEVRYFDKKSTRLMYNIEELEKENKELNKILDIERCDAQCYIDCLKKQINDLEEHIQELNDILEG